MAYIVLKNGLILESALKNIEIYLNLLAVGVVPRASGEASLFVLWYQIISAIVQSD
jgi:hypothetical protein